jgi:RNA recognition motif-containing protein
MGTKLYVGNLSVDVTEEELRDVFGADGRQISEIAIVMDRITNRPRGFAFVTMATAADAQSAMSALNGRMLGGRAIKVNEAQDRPRDGGGRSGGSRRDRY